MSILALFRRLTAAGVVLTPDPDGALHYRAPTGVLTPALLDALRQRKEELLTVVEAFEERAAISEYCGGLSRAEAEHLALRCLREAHLASMGNVGQVHEANLAARKVA